MAYESKRNRQFQSFPIDFFDFFDFFVGSFNTTSGPPASHSFARTNFNPKHAHMSCCTASFKGLYLRMGNIGHGGTIVSPLYCTLRCTGLSP